MLSEETIQNLMKKVETQLRPIADRSVLLVNLGWEFESARRWLLRLVFTHLETYLVSATSYSFDNHYRHFASEVRNPPSDWSGKVNLSQVAVRKWKGFLLLSVVLAYRELYSAEAMAEDIVMDEFHKIFHAKPDFIGISYDDWELNRKMYNYMNTALRLVSPDGKELMIRECCALLCGITKCMQGSSTGRGVNRTKIIFEHLTQPTTVPYTESELLAYTQVSTAPRTQNTVPQNKSVIFETRVRSISHAIKALKKWQHSAQDQVSKTGLLRLYLTRPNRPPSIPQPSPPPISDSETDDVDYHSTTGSISRKRSAAAMGEPDRKTVVSPRGNAESEDEDESDSDEARLDANNSIGDGGLGGGITKLAKAQSHVELIVNPTVFDDHEKVEH